MRESGEEKKFLVAEYKMNMKDFEGTVFEIRHLKHQTEFSFYLFFVIVK